MNKRLKNDLVTGNRSQAEEIVINLLKLQFRKLRVIPNDRSVLGRLEIDIYLPDYNTAIEIDGIAHKKPIYGEETLERVQKNDAKKTALLEEKKINLFRIDISEQTKDGLYPYLKDYVNNTIVPSIRSWQNSQMPKV